MPYEHPDEAELARRIEEAFRDDGMPFSIRRQLLSAEEPPLAGDDVEVLLSLFGVATSWTDLPATTATWDAFPIFASPTVFRYFLPASMRAVLANDVGVGHGFVLCLVNSLVIPTSKDQRPRLGIDPDGMSPAQRRCVGDFLLWCRKRVFAPDEKVHRRIERALPCIVGEIE